MHNWGWNQYQPCNIQYGIDSASLQVELFRCYDLVQHFCILSASQPAFGCITVPLSAQPVPRLPEQTVNIVLRSLLACLAVYTFWAAIAV
ncbi:MAG: hypothetical protein AAGF24_01100 [Cyanobacteria bacterium P01_H01_bin.121]